MTAVPDGAGPRTTSAAGVRVAVTGCGRAGAGGARCGSGAGRTGWRDSTWTSGAWVAGAWNRRRLECRRLGRRFLVTNGAVELENAAAGRAADADLAVRHAVGFQAVARVAIGARGDHVPAPYG
jgi:hypothetical protein